MKQYTFQININGAIDAETKDEFKNKLLNFIKKLNEQDLIDNCEYFFLNEEKKYERGDLKS
jgi:anti-anti-sigma regulatory factor